MKIWTLEEIAGEAYARLRHDRSPLELEPAQINLLCHGITDRMKRQTHLSIEQLSHQCRIDLLTRSDRLNQGCFDLTIHALNQPFKTGGDVCLNVCFRNTQPCDDVGMMSGPGSLGRNSRNAMI